MSLNITDLTYDLIRDEGIRLKPYTDTVGKLTIGVGRNIADNGIRKSEAIVMLNNDISDTIQDLDVRIPWWRSLDPDAQRGLANMAFNLGLPRLMGFKNMLLALEKQHDQQAATHALDSAWARQVGGRARRIATLFRTV